MISDEEILTRNKIIGVLLRTARLRAGVSVEECATVLSCDPAYILRVEEGEQGVTLPELESLAYRLEVPLASLLGEEDMPTNEGMPGMLPYDNVMKVRRKIIGVILRQAREELGRSLDEVAPTLGYTSEHLARIELGEAKVTLVELDALAQALGVPFERFVADDVIPVTSQERMRRDLKRLSTLPPHIRDFVLQPINAPYLQVAMNLSQMPAETLRQIASGLLEITY